MPDGKGDPQNAEQLEWSHAHIAFITALCAVSMGAAEDEEEERAFYAWGKVGVDLVQSLSTYGVDEVQHIEKQLFTHIMEEVIRNVGDGERSYHDDEGRRQRFSATLRRYHSERGKRRGH